MRILAAIVLVAWGFSFVRTIVNLLLIPRLRSAEPDDGPLVSVIIPARNEERRIELTVRALLAQRYRNLELIVVNDRSTDATGEILRRNAASDSRIVVIDNEEPPPGWLGKPWALHQGSLRAKGELLLFVDADIFYAPDAVGAAVGEMRKHGVAMATLLPHFELAGFWENVAMPMLAITVFTFLPTWLGNRTMIWWLGIGGGTGNIIRRDDYFAIGGHEALKDAVIDDVGLAQKVRRSGRRTMAFLAHDLISLRMYHGGGEILDGFTKNIFTALGRSYTIALISIVAGFVFHILPYILAVTGDWMSIATVAIITATRLILFASLRYRLDYAVWAHPLMVAFWGIVTLRSLWVTGVRRQVHWRGRAYDAG